MDMKKALGEALEREFVEKVEKALETLENYHKEYEVIKTSANLQAVIKFEEYQQFDKLGAYLNGVLNEAKNRYEEMKFYESALLLTKASMIKDDLDKIVEVISGRLEEEENSSELKHVNVPYIMFITKFDISSDSNDSHFSNILENPLAFTLLEFVILAVFKVDKFTSFNNLQL